MKIQLVQPGEYLHAGVTEKIIGAAMEVHRTLGPGFLESVYEEALCYELSQRKVPVGRQVELNVRYKDLTLPSKFRVDLIVDGCVLVENKASKRLTSQDEAQLINYLKATGVRIGLLFNFGSPSLEVVRRIF